MTTALIAIAMFCGLIFVHELGHFLAAKAVGVPVIEFSIGMGTPIVQRKKGETEYSLRLFPIGGYCKMEGEDEESENERAFNRQPAWARILIIISGSFMNVVAAIVILAVVHTQAGAYTNVLGTVTEGFPAYEAGLLAGDEIIAVNGESVREWADIVNAITGAPEDRISVTVLREGIEQTLYSGVLINEEGGGSSALRPRYLTPCCWALGMRFDRRRRCCRKWDTFWFGSYPEALRPAMSQGPSGLSASSASRRSTAGSACCISLR
jgi:regulator of sigma E protease